jgi:hypothetical protein
MAGIWGRSRGLWTTTAGAAGWVLCGLGSVVTCHGSVVSVSHPLLQVVLPVEHPPAEAETGRPDAEVAPVPQGGDGSTEERGGLIQGHQDRWGGLNAVITHGQAFPDVDSAAHHAADPASCSSPVAALLFFSSSPRAVYWAIGP